jgi:FMN phosphatase YigB (HAD superfamily)
MGHQVLVRQLDTSPCRATAERSAAAVRGVLFDLDGTLYAQRPVRLRMAAELMAFVAPRPVTGWRIARVLKAFRQAQELLRGARLPYDPIAQISIAADRTGVNVGDVQRIVREWMFERPLKHLPQHRAPGLLSLLDHLDGRGIRVGVLSDYAADEKLRALGVDRRFTPVLAAGDPDVRALKPDPRGFIVASVRWQVDPAEVLMVGDRADVDAAGASAAGMRSVIISRRPAAAAADLRTTFVSSFEQVRSVIHECC